MTFPEFDRAGLPWLDRQAAEIDAYVDGLDTDEDKETLRYRLFNWTQFGFVTIAGAIEHTLIDALLADIDAALDRHGELSTTVGLPNQVYKKFRELDEETIAGMRAGGQSVHARIMDFIHNSVAAKRISVHPSITRFLEHVNQDRIVAIQSLNFFVGSQQDVHQDYAFVHTNPQPALAASWVALEDIEPDSGPLFYVPGSHRIRKFDWPGLLRIEGEHAREDEFSDHIKAEVEKAALPVLPFCPKKGEAFIWHAALAHGGMPVHNPTRTRKSYVTHYSLASTHHTHVHSDGRPAERIEYPGGFVLKHPLYPDEEDLLQNGAEPA